MQERPWVAPRPSPEAQRMLSKAARDEGRSTHAGTPFIKRLSFVSVLAAGMEAHIARFWRLRELAHVDDNCRLDHRLGSRRRGHGRRCVRCFGAGRSLGFEDGGSFGSLQ